MEGTWRVRVNFLFCGLYLLVLGQSESKPSLPSDYTSMFATNYAKVSRSGVLPAENASIENVKPTTEEPVTANSSCCEGGGAGLQQIVYPDNSSVYLTVYPDNHTMENTPMKAASVDAASDGRSYKDAAFTPPKKLSYDSFFQPEAVNIPQFAQERYTGTRNRVKKPEFSRGKPARRPISVQLPYQPDFSDSLNTYLPPPPQKTYGDDSPITSYDVKDAKPPQQGPVLPYAPDYNPSDAVPSDSGYDYPPSDAAVPKKPEKSPPYLQSESGPTKYNLQNSEIMEENSPAKFLDTPAGSRPVAETGPPKGYSYEPPPEERPMSPDGNPSAFPSPPNKPMPETGPPKGYSYDSTPEERPMSPDGNPSAFPLPPNKPIPEAGPPKGYSYDPTPEERPMSPDGSPPAYHPYKSPKKPPMYEENPYEDHPYGNPKSKPMVHEEHLPYEDTYKPPKPKHKSKPKPKPKPENFFHSDHGDHPPEKLMPPSPEIPPHQGYKNHHSSHNEWLFQPETNEYYYHPDEEQMKKPKKPQKAKEAAEPKPPKHEDEKLFFEPPDHQGPDEYEHEYPEHEHHAHHNHHHQDKEPEKPEIIEDHESEDRLNKKPYSYYYIGRKLWFVPLYFSIYFIIYVTALILKSIARHKINYPHHSEPADWAGRSSRSLLNDTTDQVIRGLQNATNKYIPSM